MKFPVEKCECGLDLTTATPTRVRAIDEETVIGGCPNCWRTYLLEPEPAPPRARGRRVAPVEEPEAPPEEKAEAEAEAGPEAPPGEAPTEEPGPEE